MGDCCCSSPCCCGEANPAAGIPVVSTRLSIKDRWGDCKVRLDWGRMHYAVDPGLYAVGKPDENAPVLVSANYKLTFDSLRKELDGLDCWLLILDTKGVNVWCASGKGAFGTEELIARIAQTRLAEVVSHKTLILPQLSAVGVSAHDVKRQSGFSVEYGPVRAQDIKPFLASGRTATEEMRTVRFNLRDRLVLTPVEVVLAMKKALILFGGLFLLNLFAARPFGLGDFIAFMGAILVGTVLTPVFLPVIPGRAFAAKGGLAGLLWAVVSVWINGWMGPFLWLPLAGYVLVLPSVSAFLAMNFTGSATYTSFSGVMKEMRAAIPVMAAAAAAGLVLLILYRIFGL